MHVVGPCLERSERGDVDNPTAFVPFHDAGRSLGAEEGAFEVDAQNPIPIFVAQPIPGCRKKNCRVVHQNVQPAELLLDRAKQFANLLGARDVGSDGYRFHAQTGDLPRRRMSVGLGLVVVDDDTRSRSGERQSDDATDASASAGHQRDLVN